MVYWTEFILDPAAVVLSQAATPGIDGSGVTDTWCFADSAVVGTRAAGHGSPAQVRSTCGNMVLTGACGSCYCICNVALSVCSLAWLLV